MSSKLQNKLIDRYGNPISLGTPLKKQAFYQYGSIYEWPNQNRYRQRGYVNQDTETGASMLTRDLLLRWSKEMYSQTPFLNSAIRLLSRMVVGSEYNPLYIGQNDSWGKEAIQYLKEMVLPNCCLRGSAFDWNTSMNLIFQKIQIEGDMLMVMGEDKGVDKFQIIPSHRITSIGSANSYDIFFPTAQDGEPFQGIKGTLISDGVVYTGQGSPLGYNVQNPKNLVNTLLGGNQDNMFFSIDNCRLIFDPEYFDRGRGFPTISPGILQCLSLAEIEAYMMDKIKIQSMVAFVEKTPEGEGPQEEEEAARRMLEVDGQLGGTAGGLANPVMNASKGLRIVTDPAIRYVSTAGGEVKVLAASTSDKETSDYMTRQEQHILGTLGVPHSLLFSPDDVAGKMNESVIKTFNASIKHGQKIMDKHAKFLLAWFVARGIDKGELSPNDDENLSEIFDVTHPEEFSLNDSKINQDNLSYYNAGAKSLTELCKVRNTTVDVIYKDIESETTKFFQMAKRIADNTKQDINIVLQKMNENLQSKVTAPQKSITANQ